MYLQKICFSKNKKFDVKQLKMSKFIFDVKQMKMDKFMESI